MTIKNKYKTIYDPVHGYIKIPVDYCKNIIDTRLFQRLRHIDQTSMKSLYPSGKHDRFTHSLGVFHLCSVSVDNILKNSEFPSIPETQVVILAESIKIAALLHDVGHAPFSHTLENLYQIYADEPLEDTLTSLFPNSSFKNDIKNLSPQPHELVSSYVSATMFKDIIELLGGDTEFVARAIIGCKYKELSELNKLKNAFMDILSSKIDVDKLDYILRDTWASGTHNTTIDIERLLGSLKIGEYKGKYRLVWKANAQSVIGSVIDGRNYLYTWIYNHHKVLYEAEIINRAVMRLEKNVSKNGDSLLKKMFSLDVFKTRKIYNGVTAYLPCDADFIYLLKADEENNPYAYEFLARDHRRFPLWKTVAHFKTIYGRKQKFELYNIVEKRNEIISSFAKQHGLADDDIIVLKTSSKMATIADDDVLIEINNQIEELSYLAPSYKREDEACPFIYLNKDKASLKDELIGFIKDYIQPQLIE